MRLARSSTVALALALFIATAAGAEGPTPVSGRAARVHASAMLFDGHNDLPWRLRKDGDVTFTSLDISKKLPTGHTDLPRARQGGLKAQFWSVYVPTDIPEPSKAVTRQIDLVHRMAERYPDDLEIALDADDVQRITKEGKIASLIGIEGGSAIEGDLALLRSFFRQGARYMTLTHSDTLDWADSATDAPRHDGLTPFGERVVREMNRLGMLVDLSHVSPATMADALRIAKAPVIFSHSSAFAIAPHPRNVPDDILKRVAEDGGVVMVNFASGFIVPEAARKTAAARVALRAKYPDPAEFGKALDAWYDANPLPRGNVSDVADHVDHIIKVAGIDHVGIGADFDGVQFLPEGLEDVSGYPRLTEELLRRGHSEDDLRKILGANALRVLRRAGEVGAELRKATRPDVDQVPPKAAKP